jgi:eukaryotic-like serine/threonine-protein kinase
LTPETRPGRASRLVGTLLEGRYRVDSLIARGGMSTVYRGLDTRLDRPVAIKVMDPQYSGDASFVERFEREARAAARLHDPNVVAVYDQGVDQDGDDDRVFLVMQLVEGCTLRELLRDRGSLSPALAFSVLIPMLSALAAAHQAGMVHRDIKPENVLIGLDDSVKVADFGLVRAAASAGTTSGNIILGTVAYLSPEQVTTGAADARTDVYAAGIVLYEMLTGQPPYVGDTALSVAYRHVNDDVRPPSELVPELPPAVDDLVLRATRRDPTHRPDGAGHFLAEVQRLRAELGLPQVPVPVPEAGLRTARMAAAAAGPATGQFVPPTNGPQGTRALPRPALETGRAQVRRIPPALPPRRGGRGFTAALLILLVAGLVGGAAWWLGQGRFSTVPAVNGRPEADAVRLLQQARFVPNVTGRYDDSVPSGVVITSSPGQGSRALTNREVNLIVSLGKPQVPSIVPGTAVADAERAVRDAMLQPQRDSTADQYSPTVPKGSVVTLSPAPGTRLQSGSEVTLIISKGPQPVSVPDVRGMPRDQAFAVLTNAGFAPYDAGSQFSPSVDGGGVVSTNPAAGTVVPLAGKPRVAVVVSNAVTVPSFTGMSVAAAQQVAASAGLSLSVQSFLSQNGAVFAQLPLAGARVAPGSVIHVTAF